VVDKRDNTEKRCKHNRTTKGKPLSPFFTPTPALERPKKKKQRSKPMLSKIQQQQNKRQKGKEIPSSLVPFLSYISLSSLTLYEPEVVF
jgi:hypothetical protein